MDESSESVLAFWFGDREAGDGAIAERQATLWWQKDPATDAEIRERFADLWQQAVDGELGDWEDAPRSRLALILLLDQFTRHLHRDAPAAYEQDPKALAHSLQAQTIGQHLELRPVERVFIYLPMEHAEALMVQDECVRRFQELEAEVANADQPAFTSFLAFAERHRDVILRFDRFPHRNAVLGRSTTPAESTFLETDCAWF